MSWYHQAGPNDSLSIHPVLCFFKPAFAVIYIKLLEVSWAQILTFIQLLIFHPLIHEK